MSIDHPGESERGFTVISIVDLFTKIYNYFIQPSPLCVTAALPHLEGGQGLRGLQRGLCNTIVSTRRPVTYKISFAGAVCYSVNLIST